jgi:hypothetical protein
MSFGLIISPYDSRDYKFRDLIKLGSVNIPKEYVTEEYPFVYDQGDTQMCCACSYNAVRYLQEAVQSELTLPLSPAFTYGDRIDGEDFEGMYIRSCLKKGCDDGSVLYDDMPGFYGVYEAKKIFNERREELLTKADNFKADSYYVCSSRRDIQIAIITTKAIMTGIPIYDSFYDVGDDGIVKYDKNKDIHDYGGHAVTITGWSYIGEKLYWRLLNSWGRSWGDNGYCWLPEEYPWVEAAYAVIDNTIKMNFKEYIAEHKKGNEDV